MPRRHALKVRLNEADGAILECFRAQRAETSWVRGRRIYPNAVLEKDRRRRNTCELQRGMQRPSGLG
jgi:hypothetical protein